jgi:hypothetical protein
LRTWLRRESTELYIHIESLSQGNIAVLQSGEKLSETSEKSVSQERPVLLDSASSSIAAATIMTYQEAENPEEFFVPYLWSAVVRRLSLHLIAFNL